MIRQLSPVGFWDSTPIGRSIDLYLCQHDSLSPQLILEDKVLCAAIRCQHDSQIQFIGTLISDDESQRLTYVIDRLRTTDSIAREVNYQPLTGEFLVPIQCDNENSTVRKSLIEDEIKAIDLYCRSSSLIQLHRFSYLRGLISSRHSSSSIDLSFDLLTIKNSFILTPIDPHSVHILPTALLKNLSSPRGNSIDVNRPHFGYCTVDRMSKDKLLLILENDPQTCALPLVGIWISGISDIQCTFVWAACLRYCLNYSLKQRLRSGITPQQAFLLVCYSPSSYGQCSFYEVHSSSLPTLDYDLWTCSKQISIPDLSSYQYEGNSSIQFPYDFQFKRVYDQPKNYPRNNLFLMKSPTNDHQQLALSSPNTNGSLFGIPRIPPEQSSHQSPSWNSPGTTPVTTPTRISRSAINSSRLQQFLSPIRTAVVTVDNEWKEEFTERMKSYESQIQSLTALVTQLLTTQQSSSVIASKECGRSDVDVQNPALSPCITGKPSSMTEGNQHSVRSPRLEHRQSQTSLLNTIDRPLSTPIVQEEETVIDYSSFRRPSDVNPVDILKPIFQFIDNQQQKQQQRSSSSLMTTYNSSDTAPLKITEDDTNHQTENMFHLTNVLQQQQQHVTSTTTTGISLISNGVQMQFINQQSSTTTVYPQSQQSTPPLPAPELLPLSPQRSENSLSVEVHSLEMKYLEDDQLAAAIECGRQSKTPQVVDKSLSFGTEEYLQRYGLLTESNSS